MLSKKFRLTYQKFHQNSNLASYSSKKFILIRFKKSLKVGNRFVILVPKYLDKRSVYRHRTKRIITEAIRELLPKFKSQLDILIKAKKILNKNDKQEVKNEIRNFLFRV